MVRGFVITAVLCCTTLHAAGEQRITYSDVLALNARGHVVSVECAGDCSTGVTLADDNGKPFNHVTIDGVGYMLASVGSERPVDLNTIVFNRDNVISSAGPTAEQHPNELRVDVAVGALGLLVFVGVIGSALGYLYSPRPRCHTIAGENERLMASTRRAWSTTPQQLATRIAETADRSDAMLTAAMEEFNTVVAHLERSLQEIRNEQ